MRHHPQDVHFMTCVEHTGDEAVVVPANVKDSTVSHQIRRRESRTHVAAPVKPGSDTLTDRANFIPRRKQQPLAGKVVGVLVSDPQPVLSTEGRSGPKDQLCFARGGCSYRWVYVQVEKNPLIGRLN